MNIYVAGPFTEDKETWTEICRGIGYTLMSMGCNAIVPHMMTGDWDHTDLDYEDYMRLDLNVVERWADAVFLVANSPGADRERDLARDLGIPVLESWRDFYDFYTGRMGGRPAPTPAPSSCCSKQTQEAVHVYTERSHQGVANLVNRTICPACGTKIRPNSEKLFRLYAVSRDVQCRSCSHHYSRLG